MDNLRGGSDSFTGVKRQRLDSVLHGLMEDVKDNKRMRTDGQRWKKINQIINKPES